MRSLPALVVASALVLLPTAALADAAPPPGLKSVTFTFSVRGLAKVPDQVLFAYPCGGSNGVPKAELARLEEGKPVVVGRRGGECTLFTTSKDRFEKFMATYAAPEDWTAADKPMTEFVNASLKCSGGPKPAFSLPETEPEDEIAEALEVTTLNATTCAIATKSTTPAQSESTPATDKPADKASPAAPAKTPSGTTTTAPATTPAAPAAEEQGCSTTGHARNAAPWLVALVVPLLAFATRRRKDKR